MIATTDIKRPALRYFGGKHKLTPWIINFFPPHLNYVEPCGGAASVLIQKPRSLIETFNDLDSSVVNFFRVLRDRPDELIRKIRLTPWARSEYELSRDFTMDGDDIERARRLWVACWQSISGGPAPAQTSSGWRHWSQDERGRMDDKAWTSLQGIAARLSGVQIENRDVLEVISRYDNREVLIYFDPPYLHSERNHGNEYSFEMDISLHTEAAGLLRSAQGFVVVSGYACPLYTELYEAHGWPRFDKEAQTNSGGKRIESLWLSPRTLKALGKPMQAAMFSEVR